MLPGAREGRVIEPDPPRRLSAVPRDLHSWKEVAEYLQVSVRTAQDWEKKHGLPVKRLPGVRGGILAKPSDLDSWQHGRTPVAAAQPRPRRLYLAAALAAAVVSGAAFLAWPKPQPAAVQVSKDFLLVTDGAGKEIWRKQFPLDLIHYQNPKRPMTWVGDLDGDGDSEVLFVPAPPAEITATTPLICYDRSGEVKWQFLPGRTVRFGTEEFAPPFFVDGFTVAPIRRGGPNHILANGRHHRYYPTQVSLLSAAGKPLREYWHAGYFGTFLLHDIDGDGKSEVYLGGINNARKTAEVVVLDPEHFSGAGEEAAHPAYQMAGAARGVEIRRIFLPRTCVNRAGGFQYNAVEVLQAEPSAITVGVEEDFRAKDGQMIYYRLNGNLKPVSAAAADSFLESHHLMFQRRLIDHPWSPAEADRLLEQVIVAQAAR
jgi:hypothetical protein